MSVWPSGLGVPGELKPFGLKDPELGRRKMKLSKIKPEPLGQLPQVLGQAEHRAGGLA